MRLFSSAIKLLLRSVAFVFIVAVSLLVFFLTTTPGLYLAIKGVNIFLPGKLVVINVKGQLVNNLSFGELTYDDNNSHIAIHQGSLHWRLQDLLHRRLIIRTLQAEKIDLAIKAASASNSSEFVFPNLPIELMIKKLSITTLTINATGIEETIKNIKLAVWLKPNQWEINHLIFTARDHTFKLIGYTQSLYPYQLNAALQITPLKQPLITGKLKIWGDFSRYEWQGQFKQPNLVMLTTSGVLTQGTSVHADTKWTDFNWPLSDKDKLEIAEGHLAINGKLNDLLIDLTSKIKSPIASSLDAHAQLKADKAQLKLNANLSSTLVNLKLNVNYDAHDVQAIKGNLIGTADELPTIQLLSKLNLTSEFKGNNLKDLNITGQLSAIYLQNPLTASVNYQHQKFEGIIKLGPNQVNLESALPFPIKLKAVVPRPDLLHPLLNNLKTTIAAEAMLTNEQQGTFSLQLDKGSFELPDNPTLAFEGGNIEGLLTKKQLAITSNFSLDANKKIHLQSTLPNFNLLVVNPKQTIQGNILLTVNSLEFLSTLNPLITKSAGQLKADLSVTGLLTQPEFKGDINLTQGTLLLSKLGINLTPIDLSMHSDNKKWDAKGTVASNGKTLSLLAEGELFPIVKGKVNFTAVDFPLLNTSEYVINISPKLTLEFAPSLLKLKGEVLVPSATIKPQTFTSSVTLSDDVKFVDAPKEVNNPLNMDIDVQITMGDNVALAVEGLQGQLVGALHLIQLPKGPLTASGELNVRNGQYKAYGQNLSIEKGQLIFTGGLIDNPGIQVRAVRQFNNADNVFSGSNELFDFNLSNTQTLNFGNKTSVGIEVSGRLNTPKVQLFSNPGTLSQADILSMLILGKPANQANKSGAQLLLTAVSALNLNSGSKGLKLLSQLKENLGIDVNIASNTQYNQKSNESTDSTAVVVGKSLSKRLYLSYNVGLSQSDSNVLTLKYLLNKFFSVQVNASTSGSGIDLLYTCQKD